MRRTLPLAFSLLLLVALVQGCATSSEAPGGSEAPAPVEAAPDDAPTPAPSVGEATSRADGVDVDGYTARDGRALRTDRERSEAAEPSASDRAVVPEGRRRPQPRPQSGLLTAADVDDHLNFDFYQRYLERLQQGPQGRTLPTATLADRVTIAVRDRRGLPISNAQVTISPASRQQVAVGQNNRALTLQAGTDGVLRFLPTHDGFRGESRFRVSVTTPDGRGRTDAAVDLSRLGPGRTLGIQLAGVDGRETRPNALDLMIVMDVTGSMGDELRYITTEFESIVDETRSRFPNVDLRFGLTVYRDHGDAFVVRDYPFTRSVDAMQRQLGQQAASGGGDYPEAMDEALGRALQADWRDGRAARMLLLVADAPPHDQNLRTFIEHAEAARRRGIRMYPLAASGVAETAEYVMRLSAALTQGRHLFLTDDSGIGNAHDEPKVACHVVTRLDGLLVRVIASELAGERVEPTRQQVIREVGRYDAGVCGPVPPRTQAK